MPWRQSRGKNPRVTISDPGKGRGLFDRLAALTTTHSPASAEDIYGPDSCPGCNTPPYPAGTCLSCGYTAPDLSRTTRIFSENNMPGMMIAGLVWLIVLSMLAALFWQWFLA